MKISDKQKKLMLEEVLLKHRSPKKVAEEYNVSFGYFKSLLSKSREHGIESVLHANIKGCHPFEFKLEVARFIESGHTYGEAARKYGLALTVGRNWFLRYSVGGAAALVNTKRGRPPLEKRETDSKVKPAEGDELQQLRKQNEELAKKLRHAEMENEFLKKLDALVRERIERENKR